MQCKECNETFEFIQGFKRHIKRVHGLTNKDYVIKYEYNGIHPTCACGCGTLVSWRNDNHFLRLTYGHVTQEMRDAQGNRRRGTKMTEKQKQEKSEQALAFFQTDEGKQVANRRADNLRKFHQSEDGKKWSEEQSRRSKEFNKTEEGKEARRIAGEKISEFYKTEEGQIIKKQSAEKQHEWYTSAEGLAFLEARSEKRRWFYSTPEGKESLARASEKIRKKTRLSQEKFEARINTLLEKFDVTGFVPTYNDYVGWRETLTYPVLLTCKKCLQQHSRVMINAMTIPKCLVCDVLISKPQREIATFVRSLGLTVIDNDWSVLKTREIDVWIPEKKFGIEFNGLYHHSELARNDNNHVELKCEIAENVGIRLLTVYEDEWRDKREIVEGMITQRLGFSRIIFARKCNIISLDTSTRQLFFEKTHLEGDVASRMSWGLYDKDVLVAALSVRIPKYGSDGETLEIGRFACLPGITVTGGLSRLIKKAADYAKINGFKRLMTYVDKRVGMGIGYEKSGFQFLHKSSIRFWWTDTVNRFKRQHIQATDDCTQDEIAQMLGLTRIFGATNLVFERVV